MALSARRHPVRQTATLKALDKSQAIIEFRLDGTIITANANFLDALGYTLAEVQGKHHGMFVEPRYRESAEYRQFWERLNRGEYQAAQFKRIGKGGREVWIEASYNPILDGNGKPFKVVKFATDVTRQKAESSELKGQVEAIDKSQAVVSFALDGTVLAANDKFLAALGYTLAEVKGRHHSMFVEPAYRDSAEYRAFWAALNRGEYQAGQFKRIGKGGREVWIEASYNPILDPNGKPFKVVKFATNITAQIETLDSLKQLIDRNFGEIDRAIERTSGQAGLATGAVQTASGTVQTLAASAEELASSVREIANMMVQSKTATDAAAGQAASAGQATERLVETSSAMGGIIAVIRNIAGQINLLALNATIKFRAGRRGRQRVRGGCRRGEEPGSAGGRRDEQDRHRDRAAAGRVGRGCGGAGHDQQIDRRDPGVRRRHRERRRGAERGDAADVVRHADHRRHRGGDQRQHGGNLCRGGAGCRRSWQHSEGGGGTGSVVGAGLGRSVRPGDQGRVGALVWPPVPRVLVGRDAWVAASAAGIASIRSTRESVRFSYTRCLRESVPCRVSASKHHHRDTEAQRRNAA